MAITAERDARLNKFRSAPIPTGDDLTTLKFRLTLEGYDWKERDNAPSTDIELSHPQFGTTHFATWAHVQIHCDEDWKNTYWPAP